MAPKEKTSSSNIFSSDGYLKEKSRKSDEKNMNLGKLERVENLVNGFENKLIQAEMFAQELMKLDGDDETLIYTAIKENRCDLVKKMFPHFGKKIIQERITKLPGKSLVHAVLQYCSGSWQGYFELLFGDHQELALKKEDSDKLKQMLRKSYIEGLSPISWLISRAYDGKKNEKLAIEVVKTYPELLEVEDINELKQLPIHHSITKWRTDFLEACLNEKEELCRAKNSEKHNILHILALNKDYCTAQVFKILENFNGIYDLVRQEGNCRRSPLELAASKKDDDNNNKDTNDNFIEFSIKVKKPPPENITEKKTDAKDKENTKPKKEERIKPKQNKTNNRA